MLICFAFLGPAPYLAPFLQPSFNTVCFALVAQGFGCAAVLGRVRGIILYLASFLYSSPSTQSALCLWHRALAALLN